MSHSLSAVAPSSRSFSQRRCLTIRLSRLMRLSGANSRISFIAKTRSGLILPTLVCPVRHRRTHPLLNHLHRHRHLQRRHLRRRHLRLRHQHRTRQHPYQHPHQIRAVAAVANGSSVAEVPCQLRNAAPRAGYAVEKVGSSAHRNHATPAMIVSARMHSVGDRDGMVRRAVKRA